MISKGKISEDAVSPVVGVMLVVVITVVIAAVISGSATGIIGDDAGKTPMVMLDVGNVKVGPSMMGGDSLLSLEFSHRGGDSLNMDDIEISLMGNMQHIRSYFPGGNGDVTVNGKDILDYPGTVAEAGDSIKVIFSSSSWNALIMSGETVTWTIYDKHSEGILASGELVVP